MLYITEMETFAMNYIFLVVALLLNVCCAQQKDSIVATTTLGELIGFRVDYGMFIYVYYIYLLISSIQFSGLRSNMI